MVVTGSYLEPVRPRFLKWASKGEISGRRLDAGVAFGVDRRMTLQEVEDSPESTTTILPEGNGEEVIQDLTESEFDEGEADPTSATSHLQAMEPTAHQLSPPP